MRKNYFLICCSISKYEIIYFKKDYATRLKAPTEYGNMVHTKKVINCET